MISQSEEQSPGSTAAIRSRWALAGLLMITALIVCVSAFTTGCGRPQELSQKQLVIATGSRSGLYYPVGEILARIIKEKFPDVQVQVLETEGSMQNLSMLHEGKAGLALVQNDIAHYAAFGENMFAGKKMADLAGLATLFPEVVQIVTRKSDNLTSIAGLASRKVALGTENSGTYHNAQQILSRAKVWDSIQKQTIPPTQALEDFEKGTIDAFFYSSGLPNQKIADLASRTPLAFMPIESDLIQELVNAHPFYFPTEIPAGTYPGLASDVPGVEINCILVAQLGRLDENDHYLITKALFGSLDTLKSAHPVLGALTVNSIRRQMTIQLSVGAQQALSE